MLMTRRGFTMLAVSTAGVACWGCAADDGDHPSGPAVREPVLLPPLAFASLTTERTIVPSRPRPATPDARNPLVPADRDSLLADGFGDYEYGPGEAVIERTPDGSPAPTPGPNARRLVRFLHATDLHVADDESPVRLGSFDEPDSLTSAARPHGAHMGRVLNAAVRTANAIHEQDPIDFVMLSGDGTDSALYNEMSWLIGILSGSAHVCCDSGAADDPTSGAGNDPKDPFVAEGLAMPWRFCMGNHDALIMGVGKITELSAMNAVGDYCAAGARNWALPGGPVEQGEWIPDPDRRPLSRAETMQLVADDGDGHGLSERPNADKAFYTFDVDGSALRFVVYDSACEAGGEDGLFRQSDIDEFLRPALDRAWTEGKWVVLVAHHPLRSIGEGYLADDQTQADATPAAEVQELLCSYPNLVLSLAGHTHDHVASWVGCDGTAGFWEVQTCSLVDFPGQLRLCEISDEDNGYLALTFVAIDYATDGDDVAEEGRRLMILDLASGWTHDGSGAAEDRNVKLYLPKPA